jgi:hypothetical protein
LTRLGVPTNKEITALTKRVEELTKSVATLTRAKPAGRRPQSADPSAKAA